MNLKGVIKRSVPSWQAIALSTVSAILLAAAFPNSEISQLAWIAFVPMFVALQDDDLKFYRSFVKGWIFGTVFFFGTCWWLTFAPITYAGFPIPVAYFLLFCVTLVAGLFSGIATALISQALKRFGSAGIFLAPVFWVAAEFMRYWLTGNNWNAVGYSQAFNPLVQLGAYGGVHLVGFLILLVNAGIAYGLYGYLSTSKSQSKEGNSKKYILTGAAFAAFAVFLGIIPLVAGKPDLPDALKTTGQDQSKVTSSFVIAIQPNVPMEGLNYEKYGLLRARQTAAAELELKRLTFRPDYDESVPVTVVLPESPMNFQYGEDAVFRSFINDFAKRNRVSVLFNSAEPDRRRENGFFNSAVLINASGNKVDQYDKIHLLPFGEFVPLPEFAQGLIPPMVGRFSFGEEYDLLPFGNSKAGIMICFESHFPSLSREFANKGADVLIEMTNDGYLGPTPVLRQHLASAAFRAAETSRPVLRVTNVGVTAYINERGAIFDEADNYVEAARIWKIQKSDGVRTLYLVLGDWVAWVCSVLSIGFVIIVLTIKRKSS